MIYNEVTQRHFGTAAHAGVLTGPAVRRGQAGSREHGTWVQFDVRTVPSGGVSTVDAVAFLAFGCPHVIAVADWLAEHAVGRPLDRRLPEDVAVLQRRFELPADKLGRLLIVEDAWIAAASPPY